MNVQKVGDSVANILKQVATLALKSLTFKSPALFFSKQQQQQCWNLQILQDLRARWRELSAGSAGQQQQVQM